jgi:hypothetical protein
MGIDSAPKYKSQARYYMATFSDGLREFFQEFRQFVVMASRKLGLKNPDPSGGRYGREANPAAVYRGL